MFKRSASLVALNLWCLAVAAVAQFSPNEQLPAGPAQEKAAAACLSCHEARIIVQQRLSKAAWSKEMDKMIKWGAEVDLKDRDASRTSAHPETSDARCRRCAAASRAADAADAVCDARRACAPWPPSPPLARSLSPSCSCSRPGAPLAASRESAAGSRDAARGAPGRDQLQ